MMRIATRLCVAVAVLAAAIAFRPAAADERGVPVQEITSPGGISAWLVSDSTVPMIVMRASWPGGAAVEPAGLTGLTGVMANMLTEGAGDLDSAAFKVRLEELNMGLGFSGGWDYTSMSVTTLTRNRDAAFDMARVALRAPRFDAEPLSRIQRQLAVSIRQRETDASYLANLALDQALIPTHPYALRLTLEGVAAISQEALRARWAEVFTRDGLMVTIVGDIDAATAGAVLDHVFADLPGTPPQPFAPPATITPPEAAPDEIVRALPQPQSRILFGAEGVNDDDPDWIALAVANYILGGGGFSSRLMDEVREERGLVYGVGTSPSTRESAAFLLGSAQTENDDVAEALTVIRDVMRRLATEGATQAEVDDAIRYLTGSFPLSLDSNSNIAGVLHSYQVSGRGIDYVDQRNGLIAAVTLADVNRVAARLFHPDRFTFVVVGEPTGMAATP